MPTCRTGPPFTFFAPSNDALSALLAKVGAGAAKNGSLISEIVSYHIIPGVAASSSDLKNMQLLPTLLRGKLLQVEVCLHAQKGGCVFRKADIFRLSNRAARRFRAAVSRSRASDPLPRLSRSTWHSRADMAREVNKKVPSFFALTYKNQTNSACYRYRPAALQGLSGGGKNCGICHYVRSFML